MFIPPILCDVEHCYWASPCQGITMKLPGSSRHSTESELSLIVLLMHFFVVWIFLEIRLYPCIFAWKQLWSWLRAMRQWMAHAITNIYIIRKTCDVQIYLSLFLLWFCYYVHQHWCVFVRDWSRFVIVNPSVSVLTRNVVHLIFQRILWGVFNPSLPDYV